MVDLSKMVRSEDRGPGAPIGWPIIDAERRDDDPHRFDDCWHRGPYWRWTLRGTNLVIEERLGDGIGDLYNRTIDALRSAGITGVAWLIRPDYKQLITVTEPTYICTEE